MTNKKLLVPKKGIVSKKKTTGANEKLEKSSTIKIADEIKKKTNVKATTVTATGSPKNSPKTTLNNKERKLQIKKSKLENGQLANGSGGKGLSNGSGNGTGNLSNENIMKSIIDSYILPLINGSGKSGSFESSSFLDVKTYLPNIIVLLHQNNCLLKCLDHSNKSVENIKLRERWMELVSSLLRPSNNSLWVGIHLLCETVRVCDYDTMTLKLEPWIKVLTELVEQQKKSLTLKKNETHSGTSSTISFKEYGSIIIVLSLLVEKATKWNDLKRTITNNTVMSPIVNLILVSLDPLLGYPDECKIDSLVAISSLIQSTSTALKPYLNKIETLAYPLLYNGNKSIQESAATLISNLPQCVGINSTDLYWDVSVQKLIVEMNLIVDKVFNFLEDEDSTDSNGQSSDNSIRSINLPTNSKALNISGGGDDQQVVAMLKNLASVKFPDTPKEVHIASNFYIKAFYGLSNCLIRILSTGSTTPSPVPIDEIIKLICRVLNPNLNHLTYANLIMTFSISQMIFMIQQLHLQAFHLLSGILKIFRKQLLVHCKTISSLLLRPLRQLNYSLMSPAIHAQIYKTIGDAIESFGASSSEQLAVQVLPVLLKDILPYIPESSSSATTQNTSNASSSRSAITSTIGNVDITLQDFNSLTIKQNALSTLSSILLHCGSYLQSNSNSGNGDNSFMSSNNNNNTAQQKHNSKQICRLEIDQLLVSLLLECQSLSTVKKNSITFLNSSYNCWRYRSALYECLAHCVLKPVSNIPPVLPYAIRIFTTGMSTDNYPLVRSICCKGVSICESLIHPQCPSLTIIQNIPLNNHYNSTYQKLKSDQHNNITSDDDFEQIEDDEDDSDDDSDEDDLESEKIQLNEEDEIDDLDQIDEVDEEQEEEEESDDEAVAPVTPPTTSVVSPIVNQNIVMKTSLFNSSSIQKQSTSVTSTTAATQKLVKKVETVDISIDEDIDDMDLPDIED